MTTAIRSLASLSHQLMRRHTHGTNTHYFASRWLHEQDRSTMTVLNEDSSRGLLINSYSTAGFRLNNGMLAVGPIAIFPKSVLSWNVNTAADINEDSLSLFGILEPKIDILVIGVGDPGQKVSLEAIRYLREKRIGLELMPTDRACATFNFLNVEGRMVAAALIPPSKVTVTEDDIYLQRQNRSDFLQPNDHFLQ